MLLCYLHFITGGSYDISSVITPETSGSKTGLKRSQIYLYMKDGTFPHSIKIGPASVAWLESEIDEWINLKLANRLTR